MNEILLLAQGLIPFTFSQISFVLVTLKKLDLISHCLDRGYLQEGRKTHVYNICPCLEVCCFNVKVSPYIAWKQRGTKQTCRE